MSNSIAPGSLADVNVRVTALTTNPNVPVTYKTIILKKNLVNGVNTLTQEMMSTANTKYVIKYDYVLGDDITVPANCVLEFEGGSIKEGIIRFVNTEIKADNNVIFDNVNPTGTISNKEIPVIWFNCRPSQTAIKNRQILAYVLELAINSGTNIYHSEEGIYEVTPAYPVYHHEDGLHADIRDYNNITIYGTGHGTIIKAVNDSTYGISDVFCLNDCKNITIRDLSVTSENTLSSSGAGINGLSLQYCIENITIENCYIYDLPSNFDDPNVVVNGGHGITIQSGDPQSTVATMVNSFCKNIHIYNNIVKNCSPGLDCTLGWFKDDVIVDDIVFENNYVEDSIAGIYANGTDESSKKNKNVLVQGNTFVDCQVGIYGYTNGGFLYFNNRVKNNHEVIKDTTNIDACYGIFLISPRDCILVGNRISCDGAKNAIRVTNLSSNPQYLKSNNLIITNNFIEGNTTGDIADIQEPTSQLNIIVDNNMILGSSNSCRSFGNTGAIPTFLSSEKGKTYYNTEFGLVGFWDGEVFIDCNGYSLNNVRRHASLRKGPSNSRPRTTAYTAGTLRATDVGYPYFDTDLNKIIYGIPVMAQDRVDWYETDGARAGVNRSGTFNNKPEVTHVYVGFMYFCTSGASIDGGTTEKTNIPIYSIGNGWVDANGNAVVAKS